MLSLCPNCSKYSTTTFLGRSPRESAGKVARIYFRLREFESHGRRSRRFGTVSNLYLKAKTMRKGCGSTGPGIVGILIIGVAKEGRMWAEGPYLHALANLGRPPFSQWDSSSIRLILGTLLHEFAHAAIDVLGCRCQKCFCFLNQLGAHGLLGHVPSWTKLARAMELEANRVFPLKTGIWGFGCAG